jgi:Kef-type K+ transport system membrane component KefB
MELQSYSLDGHVTFVSNEPTCPSPGKLVLRQAVKTALIRADSPARDSDPARINSSMIDRESPMSISLAELARFLVAITIVLVAAHLVGRVFGLLRQPQVIGEILGGLLLGPTVLGIAAPQFQAQLFPASGMVHTTLSVLGELGLLLLMYLSGGELSVARGSTHKRTVGIVSALGLILPFAVGLGAVQLVDHTTFSGPTGNKLLFALVFGIGIAVTSIPVISRIMLDLGILRTEFARTVLAVAFLEDVVLYVALAIVLGLAQTESGTAFGLPLLLPQQTTTVMAAYYVVASLVFFGIMIPLGKSMFAALARSKWNFVEQRSPTAFRLMFLLGIVLICVLLGINPIFGAVLAGVAAARADGDEKDSLRRHEIDLAWDVIKKFSLALFIPLYFATVGLQLDLVHHFTIPLFLGFLTLASVTKAASVWLGARLAGENNRLACHLAVALNARGGPGIVLATVTLSAGVINENFFTILVLLSILTSQFSGIWLQHAFLPELAGTSSTANDDFSKNKHRGHRSGG